MIRSRIHKKSGFTLIEILVVMSLLVAFGYLVFSLMRSSLEIWRKGEAGKDLGEKSTAVFDTMLRDLNALHLGGQGKLLGEVAFEDAFGNGKQQGISRHLRFVRTMERAEENAILQRLGLGDTTVVSPSTPEGEKKKELPEAGGLLEIAYVTAKDPRSEDPAIQVLYRGARSVGDVASASFFSDGFLAKKSVYGDALRELSSGVLYFGLAFGRDNLESWEGSDESIPSREAMPLHCWDSTRGILGKNEELIANRFPLAKGSESLTDTRDDVFPKKILLTLVLERDALESRLTFLRTALDEEEKRIEIDDPKKLPRSYPGYIKIDAEWIELSGVEGKTAIAKRRGARSTVQTSHKENTKIHVGETFTTEIRMQQYREDWNAMR